MRWNIYKTKTFSKDIKKYSKNKGILTQLEKIFLQLEIEPRTVGKILSGVLHPSRSVRVNSYLRLIFLVNEKEESVYLQFIDNRDKVYKK